MSDAERLLAAADRSSWWRERPGWPYPTNVGSLRDQSDDEWLAQAFREAVSRVHDQGVQLGPDPMNALALRALDEDPAHPNAEAVREQAKDHINVEDADYNCEHPFCVKWWPMVRAAEARARLATAKPQPPVMGAILCSIVAGAVGFVLGLATGWGWG